MEFCDKYKVYCVFYEDNNCKEEDKICQEWRKAYNVFKNKLTEEEFGKLEGIFQENGNRDL